MWQRFTERARKAIFHAQEEALRVAEPYVSTEHILLGILDVEGCTALSVLSRLGVDASDIRRAIEGQMPHAKEAASSQMSLTPRAKKSIDLAYEEARGLDNNYLGTEHLLLGLIVERAGLAGTVLNKLGASIEAARLATRAVHHEEGRTSGQDRRPKQLFALRKRRPVQDQAWVKPAVLEGEVLRLEPLTFKHARDLAEACDAEMFQYFPTFPKSFDKDGLEEYIAVRNAMPLTVAFAIVLNKTGKAIGSSSFFDIRPADKGLEIGHTWIKKEHRGTKVNPEVKLLMFGHAFETLGAIRVQQKTDLRNTQSQRAMLKMGCKQEGVLRKNMVMPDGYIRDSVFFSVIKEEWPDVKAGLLARLKS